MALAAIVVALATLLLGTAQSPSATAGAATTEFAPTERHARVARLVSSMFERSHYRQAPVNDPVSSLVLDRYLESLDGSRSYFLASDIAEFERYRYQLDDSISGGRLEPAFAIPLAAGVAYSWGLLLTPALGAALMSLSTVIVAINAKLLERARRLVASTAAAAAE